MKKKMPGLSMILTGILLAALLTGCGKTGETKAQEPLKSASKESARESEAEAARSWNISHTALGEQYELAAIEGNMFYACRYTAEGVIVSVQGLDEAEYQQSYEIPDVTEIKSITVDFQNRVCLFGTTESGNTLWQIETNGKINTIENIEEEELGLFPSLKDFYADSNGHYYLWYEMSVPCAEVYEDGETDIYTALDRIYVKDQNMNTICYEQVPDSNYNKLLSLMFDEEDVPMLWAKDEDGYYMRRVRTENQAEYEPCRIESADMSSLESGGRIALTKDGLLYIRDGVLHLYHMKDGSDETLLELASGGIFEDDILYLGMQGERIEIVDNYKGSAQSEYTTFEVGESNQVCLSLGVMALPPEMQEVVATYNRYQNQVRIEPIIYVKDYDYDAGYERLKLDVVQGKAPDLIGVQGLDYEILANAGAFADLYLLMEKDEELHRESFLPSVLKAYEMNGGLYTAAPTFRLYTMWGGSSLVQGNFGVDMEKMMQLLQKEEGDINSIYGFSADESVLRTLCSLEMGQFINWEEGSCDFTGEAFCRVLEFVKEYSGKPIDSLYQAIRNKEILLTLGLITSVEDYCLESELYGEKIDFIGYPTAEGSGSAVLFSGNELALNAKSKYQDESWDFMKFFLLHGYDGTGFPVLKDRYEEVLAASMEEKTSQENGETLRIARKSYRERDIVNIQIFQAEAEDVEAVRELVERATEKFRYYNEIQNIIDEEAKVYLTGQKGLEEVTAIIQNRVQLYLDEQ